MKNNALKHVYPVIELLVEKALDDLSCEGKEISCKKGCCHCCYLLVEISWEEAEELVEWLNELPDELREVYIQRIQTHAGNARAFMNKNPAYKKFSKITDDPDLDMPDELCDDYFYKLHQPCPFLNTDHCAAYSVRPSPCRLHMVTSSPDLCKPEAKDDEGYEIPDRIEEVTEETTPMMIATAKQQKWGLLSIVVEEVLKQQRQQ